MTRRTPSATPSEVTSRSADGARCGAPVVNAVVTTTLQRRRTVALEQRGAVDDEGRQLQPVCAGGDPRQRRRAWKPVRSLQRLARRPGQLGSRAVDEDGVAIGGELDRVGGTLVPSEPLVAANRHGARRHARRWRRRRRVGTRARRETRKDDDRGRSKHVVRIPAPPASMCIEESGNWVIW